MSTIGEAGSISVSAGSSCGNEARHAASALETNRPFALDCSAARMDAVR